MSPIIESSTAPGSPQRPAGPATSSTTATSAGSPAPVSAAAPREDTVRISGESLVLSRLYSGTLVSYPPGVKPSSGLIYGFLTADDRALLASMYEYAQDRGADLNEVDHIALYLSSYRGTPSHVRSDAPMAIYNVNGDYVPIQMSEQNEAAAVRVLTSKAIKDSAVPEDFLRHLFTPITGRNSPADFRFIEGFVYATSRSGDATDPDAVLAPRSAEYYRQRAEDAGLLYTREEVLERRARIAAKSTSSVQQEDATSSLRRFLDYEQTRLTAALYEILLRDHGGSAIRLQGIEALAHLLAPTREDGPVTGE